MAFKNKLCEMVEIKVNNMQCVILKVKEGMRFDLMGLGCFYGDEEYIRITKGGSHHEYTVWTSETEHHTWGAGGNRSTIVSEDISKCTALIQECVQEDFGINIEDNLADTLNIMCLEDVHEKPETYQLRWREGRDDITILRDGVVIRGIYTQALAMKYVEEKINIEEDVTEHLENDLNNRIIKGKRK